MKQRGNQHCVGCCVVGMVVILMIVMVASLTGADWLTVYADDSEQHLTALEQHASGNLIPWDANEFPNAIKRGPASVPYYADVPIYTEDAILRASDAQVEDRFGFAVSIGGDTVVVGASTRGRAYVYARDHGGVGQWGEVKILSGSEPDAEDWFGRSVSISGDTIVVGAKGKAYVFERSQSGADQWGEVGILRASDIQDVYSFGCSAAISGDTIVVGDFWAGEEGTGTGAAYVYERNQGAENQWGEVQILRSSNAHAGAFFGESVSIDSETIVVGATLEKAGETYIIEDGPGAAHVFERSVGAENPWREVGTLRASDLQNGDGFGGSVSISGDTIVVGAQWEEGGEGDPLMQTGSAYVFERNQGGADQWGEVRILRGAVPEDRFFGDSFGKSVAISGDIIIVGAYNEDGGKNDPITDAGVVYLFTRNEGGANQWGIVGLLRSSEMQEKDWFGISTAISGDTIVVGAMEEDGGVGDPITSAGAAYVFSGIVAYTEQDKTAPSDEISSEAQPLDDSSSEAPPRDAEESEQGPAICPLLPTGFILVPGFLAMVRRRKISM